MSAEEEKLLQEAVEGDRDALASLFKLLGSAIRRRLAGKIPKRWQSVLSEDDVMQQSYSDAFRNIQKFTPQGVGSFVAWMSTLAERNLFDAIKMLEADKRGGSRRRVEWAGNDESFVLLHEQLAVTSTTPSRHMARNEAVAAVRRALTELPEAYGRVVQMYDLEGRPAAEVAEAMNRTTGAIFMLRVRAHARLQEIMGMRSDFLSQ